jgi:NACalpha-BTF3-like transcription factor
MRVMMQGQASYQISGEESEESLSSFSDDDVQMVVEKTGKSKDKVIEFLKENDGDIAKAIMELK